MTTPEQPHEPPAGLRIAYVPGVTLTKWRRIWAERFPEDELTIREVTEKDQRAVLIEDVADIVADLEKGFEAVRSLPAVPSAPSAATPASTDESAA